MDGDQGSRIKDEDDRVDGEQGSRIKDEDDRVDGDLSHDDKVEDISEEDKIGVEMKAKLNRLRFRQCKLTEFAVNCHLG